MKPRHECAFRWGTAVAVLAVGWLSARCEPQLYRHSVVYSGADPDELVRATHAVWVEGDWRMGPPALSADLDGDGNDDIVGREYDRLFFALGPALIPGRITHERVDAWTLVDADGQGSPELVTSMEGTLQVFSFNRVSNQWTPAGTGLEGPSLEGLAAGDVDGDGMVELIGLRWPGLVLVDILPDQSLVDDDDVIPSKVDGRLQISDVDGDGIDDIVSKWVVLFGSADGNYEEVQVSRNDVAHDFDADGDLDLIKFIDLTVQENLDGRSFGEPKALSLDSDGRFFSRVDVLDDAEPELILVEPVELGWERIHILARSEDGAGLEVLQVFDEGTEVDGLVTGDFDGNGTIDLLYSWEDGDSGREGCG